jgi:hypothetical protein
MNTITECLDILVPHIDTTVDTTHRLTRATKDGFLLEIEVRRGGDQIVDEVLVREIKEPVGVPRALKNRYPERYQPEVQTEWTFTRDTEGVFQVTRFRNPQLAVDTVVDSSNAKPEDAVYMAVGALRNFILKDYALAA